jgi:LacI family transcriptional regulator
LEAIKKLNFRPNAIARSLRKSSKLTIGILNSEVTAQSPYIMPLMVGVEETARERGFSVFLCNTDGKAEREASYLEMLLDKQVNGVIFINSKSQPRAAPVIDLGPLPFAFLYQYAPDVAAPSVMPDDKPGGYTASKYLIDLGHERIG